MRSAVMKMGGGRESMFGIISPVCRREAGFWVTFVSLTDSVDDVVLYGTSSPRLRSGGTPEEMTMFV